MYLLALSCNAPANLELERMWPYDAFTDQTQHLEWYLEAGADFGTLSDAKQTGPSQSESLRCSLHWSTFQ